MKAVITVSQASVITQFPDWDYSVSTKGIVKLARLNGTAKESMEQGDVCYVQRNGQQRFACHISGISF